MQYIDFDSLKPIPTHIGKDITISEGILLGPIVVGINDSGKIVYTQLNNDLIAINDLSIAVDILSKYKSEILTQPLSAESRKVGYSAGSAVRS